MALPSRTASPQRQDPTLWISCIGQSIFCSSGYLPLRMRSSPESRKKTARSGSDGIHNFTQSALDGILHGDTLIDGSGQPVHYEQFLGAMSEDLFTCRQGMRTIFDQLFEMGHVVLVFRLKAQLLVSELFDNQCVSNSLQDFILADRFLEVVHSAKAQ